MQLGNPIESLQVALKGLLLQPCVQYPSPCNRTFNDLQRQHTTAVCRRMLFCCCTLSTNELLLGSTEAQGFQSAPWGSE